MARLRPMLPMLSTLRLILEGAPALLAAVLIAPSAPADAGTVAQSRQVDAPGAVLAPRDRVEPVNRMLTGRLTRLLPTLMREAGLDMWVVVNREYAEDPVYFTLVPEPVFAARRTTMLVFHDRGVEAGGGGSDSDDSDDGDDRSGGLELLSVSRYPLGEPYEAAWEGGDLDAQWRGLARVIAERDPRRIGIDVSRDWPVADGLTASLADRLREALRAENEELADRLVPAEELVIRWMETRSAEELAAYPHVVSLARGVVAEAFSARVITPGVTTTDDVAWAIRERFEELGLTPWFQPYVDIQRAGTVCEPETPFCGDSGVIRPGDVLHTDVGVCYLRLCTDTQEMAYVLRTGEEGVPEGLVEALATGNRWQDLLTGEIRAGRTGNEVLAATLAAQEAEGIVGSVYSHPLGFFGHAPGPTIGMWDHQGQIPVRGDWPIRPSTAYAVEGSIKVRLPEWDGQWVQIKLEQSAVFAPEGSEREDVVYLAGRQGEWLVVE